MPFFPSFDGRCKKPQKPHGRSHTTLVWYIYGNWRKCLVPMDIL
jgi:hypothetical protein